MKIFNHGQFHIGTNTKEMLCIHCPGASEVIIMNIVKSAYNLDEKYSLYICKLQNGKNSTRLMNTIRPTLL